LDKKKLINQSLKANSPWEASWSDDNPDWFGPRPSQSFLIRRHLCGGCLVFCRDGLILEIDFPRFNL
jgi:hypothetical protein